MAYRDEVVAYAASRAMDERSAAVANGLNKAFDTFQKVRQDKTQREWDMETNRMKHKADMLRLDEMENDPTHDPAVRASALKQLKLGNSKKEAELEYANRIAQQDLNYIARGVEGMKSEMQRFAEAKAANPELFKYTRFDPATGRWIQGKSDPVGSDEFHRTAKAIQLATEQSKGIDGVDEQKYEKNLKKNKQELGVSSVSDSEQDKYAPDVEEKIAAYMEKYKRPREQIVASMKKQKLIAA